jgi:phosphate transport system protein
MLRQNFELELQRLRDEVLVLGSMVEKALTDSVRFLERRDLRGARALIDADHNINSKRFSIEEECLALIATQHPKAGDLRALAAVLEIATELERIGDYAKGIARINLMMGHEPLLRLFAYIPRMSKKASDMLHWALDAFVRRDVALARAIPAEDDEVDALYNLVYRGLLDFIIADQEVIDRATYLLWVAHNLERAADRVINICERVVFTVTGEMVELGVKDGLNTTIYG